MSSSAKRQPGRAAILARAAVLVVLGTTPALAGDKEAGELFKEALGLSTQALGTEDPAEKVRLLTATEALLGRIVADHADSKLGELLAAGKPVGRFSRADVQARLAAARDALPEGTAAAAVAAPTRPATPEDVRSPALKAALAPWTAPGSPLVGDWAGDWSCERGTARITLSIMEADGLSFSGYVDFRQTVPAENWEGRYHVSGFVDPDTRAITITSGDWIKRPRNGNIPGLNGTIDMQAGVIDTNLTRFASCSYGNQDPDFDLVRQEGAPVLGLRTRAFMDAAAAWRAEELARPRPGRTVGATPEGTVTWPDCEGFQAWYAAADPTARVNVLNTHGEGILPHYGDAVSAKAFGSPAYHWLVPQYREFRGAFDAACKPLYKADRALYDRIRSVVHDRGSWDSMNWRRKADERLVTMIPDFLGQADSAARQMAVLKTLNSPGEVRATIGDWYRTPQHVTDADVDILVADVLRYQEIVAEELVAEAVSDITTAVDLAFVNERVAKVETVLGAGFEDEKKTIADAAEARRLALVESVLADRRAAIRALPDTLDSLDSLGDIVVEASAALPGQEAAIVALEADARARRAAIAGAEADRRIAALADRPASAEGLVAVRESVATLADAVGADGADAVARLKVAAEARVAAIATALIADAQSDLAALPADLDGYRRLDGSVKDLRETLATLAPAAVADAEAMIATRAAALAEAVVDAQVAAMAEEPETVQGLSRVAALAELTAGQMGDADPALLARLGEAAAARRTTILDSLVTARLSEMEALPPSLDSFAAVDATMAEVHRLAGQFGVGEALVTRAEAAATARRDALAASVVEALVTDLGERHANHDGLIAARRDVAALSARLAEMGQEMKVVTLENALAAYTGRARQAILEAATADISSFPVDPETFQGDDLAAIRAEVLSVVGTEPPLAAFEALDAAIAAKEKAMAEAAVPGFEAWAAGLPAESESVNRIRRTVAGLPAAFETAGVLPRMQEIADARVTAILDALKQGVLDELAAVKAGHDDVPRILAYGDRAAADLEALEGAVQAQALREEVATFTAAVLRDGLEGYRVELANHARTLDTAWRTAEQSLVFGDRVGLHAGYADYAEAAADFARELAGGLCDEAAKTAGVAGDGDTVVVVGEEMAPMRSFVCALSARGTQVSEYDAPGFFGGDTWTMRLFTAREDWITLTLERRKVRPGAFALVAVQVTQDGDAKALSLKDWRRLSQGLTGGDPLAWMLGAPAGDLCKLDAAALRDRHPDDRMAAVFACD